jgi:hypothetical protein
MVVLPQFPGRCLDPACISGSLAETSIDIKEHTLYEIKVNKGWMGKII